MIPLTEDSPAGARNHPYATRMAIIAFITGNITLGTLWGSFSVLLGAVETRLGVGRELSTLSVPAVNLAMAGMAPVVGMLAARHSLRLIMVLGALASTLGFVLLAATASYPLYILAYGLLLGPGMAAGVILPATLVTRWFLANRGRTLGLVCMPVMVAVVPLVATGMLQSYGLTATYGLLAALSAIPLVANLFIIDHPPTGDAAANVQGNAVDTASAPDLIAVPELLRSPRFWALVIAAAASMASSVILGAHIVPMAGTWGFTPVMAATLLTVQSLVGIAGTILFGWIADRIGSVLALAIVVFDGGVLWSLLLLQPPFAVTLVIIGLIGLHGAGVMPVLSLALSETFGARNFSRAYGIANLANLPFAVLCVPAAAIVYTQTGSYAGAVAGQVVFFGIATLLALSVRRPAPKVAMA